MRWLRRELCGREDRSRRLALWVIVLAIFGAGFWGSAHISEVVFDGVPHVEDEHAFLFQAKVFATGRLSVASPAYPEFFPSQFVVDYFGQRFGKYPPGYPLVLSIGVLAGQPRLVNPLLGAAALVVVFLIGRALYDSRTGLLAAGLGLVSPFFLMTSGSYMSHSTAMLFLALFVLFFVKSGRSGSLVFPLLAGASLGLAFLTRQLTAVGIALPFVLYGLIDLRRGRRSFARYGLMAMAFVPLALFLLYFNYTLTRDAFLSPHELWWSFDKIGFGPREQLRETLAIRWLDTRVNFWLLSDYLFGWPARLSLAFMVVPFLRLSRTLWDWLLLAAAASLLIAYMAYWTSGEMYGPRYTYEALPMLLILTARGMIEITGALKWLIGRVTPGRMGVRYAGDGTNARFHLPPAAFAVSAVAVALAVLVYAGMTGFLPREMAYYKDWYGVTANPLRIVHEAGLRNALVFVANDVTWTEFAELDIANSPDYDSDVVFAADFGDGNDRLIRLYPGRSLYRMSRGVLAPYAP